MTKKITVYTTNSCASCRNLKKYLDTKGYAYDTINLDDDLEERQKVIALTGYMEVPVTIIEDTEKDLPRSITVGWKPGAIMAALGA